MRTMYDAVTPTNIPRAAQMVAGYVDGKYAWTAAEWALFPHATKVRIAVFSSTNDGHVLDVEPGCSSPTSAPGWVVKRRAAGVDPSVYCNLSTWPTVRTAFHNAGIAEPHWWIAAYPGIGAKLYPGTVGHQFANPGPVDVSIVADYWPGVDLPIVSRDHPRNPVRGPFPLAVGHGYTVGSRGWGVVEIQMLTGAMPVDGAYGPITSARVQAWTKLHGPYTALVVNKQVWDHMAAYQQPL